MEERSAFQFFRSFYDAARKIPDKEMQADFLLAICEYALNGNPPEETGIIGALFELVKPNLDTSRKRAQAGRVGGEAKRSNAEANVKQNEAKPSKTQNPVSDGEGEEEGDVDGDVEEKKRGKENAASAKALPPFPPRPQIPYDSIRDAYNEICASFPRCTAINESRKKAIRARFNAGYTLDDFRQLFHKAENSSFLRGRNDRNWSATFDWLVKDSNMAKVLEGNYDDSGARSGPAPKQPQRQSWADLARQMDEEEGVS
jgi:hypothetical protein